MRPRASTPSCTIRGWRRMWRKTRSPRRNPAAARILRRILMAAKPVSADKAPPQAPAVNGWIIIDKPLGLTSTQVVPRPPCPEAAQDRPRRHSRSAGQRPAADRPRRGHQDGLLRYGRAEEL